MAPAAVVQWKGNLQMTDTTVFTLQDVLHVEVFRGLFLDVEDIGMAIRAIEPLLVLIMWKLSTRDQSPIRIKLKH